MNKDDMLILSFSAMSFLILFGVIAIAVFSA